MKGLLQSLPLIGRAFTDIHPEEVRAFWRHMQDHFTTTVVNKSSSLEMQEVEHALEVLGIQRRDLFLRKFTTTIGRKISPPFEVGVPRTGWELWNQVTVCVHEHQHVVQHDREGAIFDLGYVADRAARGLWEAEAYRSNLELSFWRYGNMPSPRRVAATLAHYGCRPRDIAVAEKSLALSSMFVRRGAIVNEASRIAMQWLNENVPHLRSPESLTAP